MVVVVFADDVVTVAICFVVVVFYVADIDAAAGADPDPYVIPMPVKLLQTARHKFARESECTCMLRWDDHMRLYHKHICC